MSLARGGVPMLIVSEGLVELLIADRVVPLGVAD